MTFETEISNRVYLAFAGGLLTQSPQIDWDQATVEWWDLYLNSDVVLP